MGELRLPVQIKEIGGYTGRLQPGKGEREDNRIRSDAKKWEGGFHQWRTPDLLQALFPLREKKADHCERKVFYGMKEPNTLSSEGRRSTWVLVINQKEGGDAFDPWSGVQGANSRKASTGCRSREKTLKGLLTRYGEMKKTGWAIEARSPPTKGGSIPRGTE